MAAAQIAVASKRVVAVLTLTVVALSLGLLFVLSRPVMQAAPCLFHLPLSFFRYETIAASRLADRIPGDPENRDFIRFLYDGFDIAGAFPRRIMIDYGTNSYESSVGYFRKRFPGLTFNQIHMFESAYKVAIPAGACPECIDHSPVFVDIVDDPKANPP